MDIFDINNYQFITDDPDVLLRVKNPRYDSEITFLTTDGTTIANEELYQIERMGDQWFVIINNPLLQERIKESIRHNADEYGIDLARFLPLSYVIHSSLESISEEHDREHGKTPDQDPT